MVCNKLEMLKPPDDTYVGGRSWMENHPVLATSYVTLALQLVQDDLVQRSVR